jgi:hypothetical protein
MRLVPLAAVLVAVLPVSPAVAKLDGPKWKEAETKFRSLFADAGQAPEKIAALKEVMGDGESRAFDLVADGLVKEANFVGRLTERHAEALAKLQVFLAKKDDDWRPGEENEMMSVQADVQNFERALADDRQVLDAIAREIAAAGEAARKVVIGKTRSSTDWCLRAAAARIAGGAPDELASKAMLQEALEKDKDPRVRIAALQALSTAPGTSWHALVVGRVEDPDWTVQVEAAKIAGTREVGRAIPNLIQALAKAQPRLAEEVVGALRKLTRQNFDPDAGVWAKWWADHRSEFGEDGRPTNPTKTGPRSEDIEFYGLKIKSDRVVFVIDTSGSMKEEIKHPDPTAGKVTTGDDKPKAPQKFSGPKIEVAKQELKRAIEGLPASALFNVIAFNHAVRQWQPTMMPATPENKEAAYSWFRNEPPKGSTYIDGALRMAFKLAGNLGFDKQYSQQKVDTIVLLSDGAPTDNSMPVSKDMDPEEILTNVREWNVNKSVIINCVGIDNVVQGIEFMKKLAKQNGGTYVDG